MRPRVLYAASGGVSIAYQVVGSGAIDLVFQPGFVSHLDLAWEEPFLARFLEGLAGFSRVIWFDKRGTGLSDPVEPDVPVGHRLADIRAVMDAAGARRAALFASALAQDATIGRQLAEALKAEARNRIASGTFFGHIAYASVLATRP